MQAGEKQKWVPTFLIAGVIWGSSFLFIEQSLTFLSPAGVAFWRTFLGAVVLIAVIAVRRLELPKTLRPWLLMLVGGLFMSAIPATLFGFAQQQVSSSLASIMNASTPIFTVLAILIAFPAEKPKPQVILGLLIGLVGVGVVLGVWSGFGENDPLAILALVAAVGCYGFGSPFIRRFVEPLGLSREVAVFGQVSTSALVLAPLYLAGGVAHSTPTAAALGSILALGALGTGFAYILYYRLLATVGSPIASAVTYITPVIGVALGILLLGETLTWHEPVGALIVIAGAYVAQRRRG
jgi:drug/metabolite transporter (DMT)-like permease